MTPPDFRAFHRPRPHPLHQVSQVSLALGGACLEHGQNGGGNVAVWRWSGKQGVPLLFQLLGISRSSSAAPWPSLEIALLRFAKSNMTAPLGVGLGVDQSQQAGGRGVRVHNAGSSRFMLTYPANRAIGAPGQGKGVIIGRVHNRPCAGDTRPGDREKETTPLVREHLNEHESQWASIQSIAAKIGGMAKTLWRWLLQAERDGGEREGVTPAPVLRGRLT